MLILRRRRQRGQAIVIIAMTIVVLIAAIGLAIDGARMYFESVSAERAAAAGALSGVVDMPAQFNNAQTRAIAEAKRNGFDAADPSITITVAAVAGQPQELSVTVTHRVPLAFMVMFGINTGTVARQAIAGYLSPISIGQPGQQLGPTVSQLGTANNFYFLRSEGWSTTREQGDPFTPNPCTEYGGTINPCSSDQHQFSAAANDPVGTASPLSLPDRGGQNYYVTIGGSGGSIWVYNAAFAPDGHNPCENTTPRSNSGTGHGRVNCAGGSYNFTEDDNVSNPPLLSEMSTMKYTIFQVQNLFQRNQDIAISTLTVFPLDAHNWDPGLSTAPTYLDKVHGTTLTQTYSCSIPCAGNATNMWTYHHWLDPRTYSNAADCSGAQCASTLSTWNSSFNGSTLLPAGTYRLRVDTMNPDGTNPPGSSTAHKGYSVAVSAAVPTGNALTGPTTCSGCSIGAWNDMTVYTPVSGSTFTMPIFSLPASYAGQTIVVEFYDLGDVSGNSTLDVLDPSGAVATAASGKNVLIVDLGRQRSNAVPGLGTVCNYNNTGGENVSNAPCTVSNGSTASFVTNNGYNYYNGHWVHIEIPIPPNYNPAGSIYWSLRYNLSSGTATDTFAMHVGLKGSPARLLSS